VLESWVLPAGVDPVSGGGHVHFVVLRYEPGLITLQSAFVNDTSRMSLEEVAFWAYQIQALDEDGAVDALANSRYDLLVLEPTRSDQSTPDFDTAAMVSTLHQSSAVVEGRMKLAVAYVDIGEAEDWRWYWEEWWEPPTETEPGTPDFMLAVDPDGWEGCYPVAFWDTRWKNIMIYNEDSALDQLLDDGFDGIYMDWVAAFNDEIVEQAAYDAGLDPQQEMIDFITEIRDYARARNPEFLIIPQNAPEIDVGHFEYHGIIDGIAMEDIYFYGLADVDWDDPQAGDIAVPETGEDFSRQWFHDALVWYGRKGLPILTVDYCRQPANVEEVWLEAYGRGFIPYCSLTPLDRLSETPPTGLP